MTCGVPGTAMCCGFGDGRKRARGRSSCAPADLGNERYRTKQTAAQGSYWPTQIHGGSYHEEDNPIYRRDQRTSGWALATSRARGRACPSHTLFCGLHCYPGSLVSLGNHRVSVARSRNHCNFLVAQAAGTAVTSQLAREGACGRCPVMPDGWLDTDTQLKAAAPRHGLHAGQCRH